MNLQISFGTDGIRGNSLEYPFSTDALKILGKAIGQWSIKKYNKNPLCLVAHDTRISCLRIKKNLINGLLEEEVKVVDGNILPTPTVLEQISKNNSFDFGVVISASHNPYSDNGIKLFDSKTGKLSPDDEQKIVSAYSAILNSYLEKNSDIFLTQCETDEKEEFVSLINNENSNLEIIKSYKNFICSYFKENFLEKVKIVLDCANGATYKLAPEIFKYFGAEVIAISTNPDGKNINDQCGSLNLKKLQDAVLQTNANCGFAFDGDGDRVIAITKNGEIKDGDDLLSILISHPKIKSTSHIVGTVMSNFGLEEYFRQQGKTLIRTKVGDKYIRTKLEEESLILGGEPSGHIIMMDYINTGDGIFVALRALETIIEKNNWSFESFKKCPQILLNVPIEYKASLHKEPFCEIIKIHEEILKNGRLVVRYSGTENVLRIMTEDTDENNAIQVANALASNLQKAILEYIK